MAAHAKKRKIDNECRVFNRGWTAKYLFTEIKGKAVCLVCGTQVAVLKDYNLNRHYTTKHEDKYRKRAHKGLFTKLHTTREAAVRTSYVISHKIARKSKAFSDGEFIKECLLDSVTLICPEKKDAFENVSLSRHTVTRRVEDIAENLELQLKNRAADFEFFSLALDESCDVRDTAQLLIFLRGITADFQVTEELAAMQSMKGTTTGNDLFTAIVNGCLEKLGLKWDNLAGVTTVGCPNLTGKNVGLLKRMQDKVTEINPEVLCNIVLKMDHVVDVVTKTVNFIRARALNHRQFIALLEENEMEHGDISYHCSVRWLSLLSKVLKSVWDLREQIQDFCVKKGHGVPELSDEYWVADLGFGVDVTALMNQLNVKLQCRGLFVHEMYSAVKAFMRKLQLISSQVKDNFLTHLPTLKEAIPNANHLHKYSAMLEVLHAEFSRRFQDFKALEMDMVSSPFTCSVDNASSDVQMELIDLRSDTLLAEHFRSVSLLDFYSSLKEENFPHLRNHAQRMLVLFGSTYVCEQTFSVMKFNKSKHRSSVTDDHLSAVLHIATSDFQPDFNALVQNQNRLDYSH
ncbi:C-C motif chemokine 24 [Sarotherodon galilaeus]